MRLALIVTTYERADALARVLDSVRGQCRTPDELVVADDGSGPGTRQVVAQFSRHAPCPVVHSWQPDEGWRLARSRNLALARTRSEYVVLVDGDMLLDAHFLADHEAHARPGTWVQGCRLPLDSRATTRLVRSPPGEPGPRGRDTDLRHRLQAAHCPVAARLLARPANLLLAIKGCNQAFWRADLVRANGWDESIEGWGPEDKELCARLANAGVRRRSLMFGGIAWHLHHASAAPRDAPAGRDALRLTRSLGRVRCERGLDAHGETDAAAR
jgi:glycosyltransferase involved in cell wall biosynthesis